MQLSKIPAVGALALLGLVFSGVPKADAAYIVTVQQVGANVVASGSGSLDLTDLSLYGPGSGSPYFPLFDPSFAMIVGSYDVNMDEYHGPIVGPTSFGSGNVGYSTLSGSGPIVGIAFSAEYIDVPTGYTSGTLLGTSSDTWDNWTLAALGATPGTYTWTWGSGAHADSFTLNIESPVPEPASFALLGTAVAALGLSWRRKMGHTG